MTKIVELKWGQTTKISELRIGNYVLATCPGNQPCDNLKQIKNGIDIDNASWFFSIQITEEILSALNFACIKNGFRISISDDDDSALLIVVNKKGEFEVHIQDHWFEIAELPPIKYVHDLQNLYFALSGKELEFNE